MAVAKKMSKPTLLLPVAVILLLVFASPVFAEASFYEGKTITLALGGLGDFSNRAVVPFLKKYIPGKPDIIIEYMPGGGGRKLANYMYNVARPDGLTIGWAGSSFVANFALRLPGVEYDIHKVNYVAPHILPTLRSRAYGH